MIQTKISTLGLVRRGVGALVLLALAAVFIVSGWSKMQTLEPFIWSFIDILPIGFTAASVLAHLFIGLEWLLGLWLAAHVFLRPFTYKATVVLLLLLCGYLGLLILQRGNTGNCGCFGEWLYMKPGAAIMKNMVMIAIIIFLWYFYPGKSYKNDLFVALALAMAAFAAPFVIAPVAIHGEGKVVNRPIDLAPLYESGIPKPNIDLRKGKHIICYFSTTCPHCKKAAFLTQILHRRNPEFPIYLVLNGTDELEHEFFDETHSTKVPHSLMTNTPEFTKMAGSFVPAIFWINNGVVEKETYYTELEPDKIKAWLAK